MENNYDINFKEYRDPQGYLNSEIYEISQDRENNSSSKYIFINIY